MSSAQPPSSASPCGPVDSAPHGPVDSASRCPVCASPVGEPSHCCERCDTPHHAECWDYLGGCAIFGCQAPAPRPNTSSLPPVTATTTVAATGSAANPLPTTGTSTVATTTTATTTAPLPVTAPILSRASDLALLIRRQSRSVSIISGGLISCFVFPLLVALLALMVLIFVNPGGGSTFGEAAADHAAWSVFYRVATASIVVGLLVAGWGLVTFITATIRRRRAEAALTSALGAPFSVGGADRSRILSRLDLSDTDRRTVANGESMGDLAPWLGLAALVMAVMTVVGWTLGQRELGDWYFFLDLHLGPLPAPLIAAPLALIAFLRARSALCLVDLQVTLNRIEAAGKGAMDGPGPAGDAR